MFDQLEGAVENHAFHVIYGVLLFVFLDYKELPVHVVHFFHVRNYDSLLYRHVDVGLSIRGDIKIIGKDQGHC